MAQAHGMDHILIGVFLLVPIHSTEYYAAVMAPCRRSSMNRTVLMLSGIFVPGLLPCADSLAQPDMKTTSQLVVRNALGAGRWFPATKSQLEAFVNESMAKAQVPAVEGRIVAAIAPHAGYQYSGLVAGYTFQAIRDNAKSTNAPAVVVILGLSHHQGFSGTALMDGDAIETPMGQAPLDRDAAKFLIAKSDSIRINYAPHIGEHSAENEVPFAQAALPGTKLVIGIIGDHDEKTLNGLVDALVALAKEKKVLVVASSDMLHDPDYDLVTSTDKKTLKKVEAMDDAGIWTEWMGDHHQHLQVRQGNRLVPMESARDLTTDWVEQAVTFNSLDNTNVNMYAGIWGGKTGKIWWDDLRIDAVPTLNMLRRESLPLRITAEDGTVYQEGLVRHV